MGFNKGEKGQGAMGTENVATSLGSFLRSQTRLRGWELFEKQRNSQQGNQMLLQRLEITQNRQDKQGSTYIFFHI